MKKIIVYGLGDAFEYQIVKLASMYDIVGYSDKRVYSWELYILPDAIKNEEFDFVCVTSPLYFNEIKSELISVYEVPEHKIRSGEELVKTDIYNKSVRDKWVKEQIQNIEKGKKILDAGAGEQQYKQWCSHLQYTSQDFCQYDGTGSVGLQNGKWDVSMIDIVSDIINIPLEDSCMDAILCTEVFEHIAYPVLAIQEFARILNRGGKLILSAPFASLTHMAPYHYYSGYNRYWYEKILEENGFRIIEITPYGNYFEYIMQELARVPSVVNDYSDFKMSKEKKIELAEMVHVLKEVNKKNKGSEEILCFGYLVVAEYIG